MNAQFTPPPGEPWKPLRIEDAPKSLAALRQFEPDAAPWQNIEWVMFVFLLSASQDRRTNAGPEGLMLEAATTVIAYALRDVATARRTKGGLLLWDSSIIKPMARELADEMKSSHRLKLQTVDNMKSLRNLVWNDGKLTKHDQRFQVEYDSESAVRTFNRSLDYIEHLRGTPDYKEFIALKRFCCSCVRVINAVFDCHY